MSIAGGLPNAVRRGVAAGCGVVQLFLKNQLRWAGRSLGEPEVVEFRHRPERLALCLDTCHLFAAGYDIRTPRRFAAVLDEFDRSVGLDQLAAFHLNDSRAGLASKLDRHENIGAGRIGLAAFRFLLTHPRVGTLPMILETPKRDDGDARNLATLRGLSRRSRRPR